VSAEEELVALRKLLRDAVSVEAGLRAGTIRVPVALFRELVAAGWDAHQRGLSRETALTSALRPFEP